MAVIETQRVGEVVSSTKTSCDIHLHNKLKVVFQCRRKIRQILCLTSLAAAYAWITWQPGGARDGSRVVGMEIMTWFCGASIGSQLLMTL
jgi:hypothetical protein